MKWLLEWNRGRYDPSLGHLSRTEPSRDEKRHAFEKFYKGWRDYMEGRPMFAPPDQDEAARQWYHSGYEKAHTEGPAKELVTSGQELPRYPYSRTAEKRSSQKPGSSWIRGGI